jgi:hypothetical protein
LVLNTPIYDPPARYNLAVAQMKIHPILASVYARAFVVWLFLLVAMFVHGAVRAVVLEPRMGNWRARQLSVFSGSLLIFAITFAFSRWMGTGQTDLLLRIGVLWVLLTVMLEIGLGLGLGKSLGEVLADFDVLKGGLFPILLVVEFLSPLVAAKLRHLR